MTEGVNQYAWKIEKHSWNYIFVFAMFMDLSKAFGTKNHDLLIVKLGANVFQEDVLSFMKSY